MIKNYSAIIEILFWIGIGIVFYTYLGYGIVLYLMVKIKELFVKPRLPRLPETLPEATLLIAAYNEEAIVASKMVNCRQLDYPADKLRLVWITDGSNDNTNERLKEYPEVTVLYQPRRQGKTAAESGISSSSAHCASEAYCVGKLMSSMPLCSSTSIWRRKLS